MDLYPAIDLRGGRVVRLLRGDYDAETAYDDDPVARARAFADAGARWVHVVDLDAARTGDPANLDVVRAVCEEMGGRGVQVQVGGGVRTAEAAARLLDAGADRVVVGTAAVETPELVDELAGTGPGRVAVGIDARGDRVAVRGWTEEASGTGVLDLARRFDRPGVGALVVTSIERDGTMEGPGLELLGEVLGRCGTPVVASGGIGTLDDLRALGALEAGGRGLAGAIVGRALYEGRFELEEALRVTGGRVPGDPTCLPSG